MAENVKMRRVLVFGPYDVARVIDENDLSSYEGLWDRQRYQWLRRATVYLGGLKGKAKEDRKRIKEIQRKFRSIGETFDDEVKTLVAGQVIMSGISHDSTYCAELAAEWPTRTFPR